MFEGIRSVSDEYRTSARLRIGGLVYNVSFFRYEGKGIPAGYAGSMETFNEGGLHSVAYDMVSGKAGVDFMSAG